MNRFEVKSRPRRSGLILVTAITVFLGLLATGAQAQPLRTGVTAIDLGQSDQLGYDRVASAGASYTRVIVYWSDVSPEIEPIGWNPADPEDPNYDWQRYDEQILKATAAGLVPIVMVYSAPRWAERCRDSTVGICNPNPERFAEFSGAVARRYSGLYEGLPKVRHWIPWNEPNLQLSFKPQFKNGKAESPRLYGILLREFARAIKAVDPTNKVMAGGLAPIGVAGAVPPLKFMRDILCMKAGKHPSKRRGCGSRATFDIWATNPFTTGGPTHKAPGDSVSLGDLSSMHDLLKAAKRDGRIKSDSRSIPFWITEFSWDSAPPDPGGLPMPLLSRWTAEAMYRAWLAGADTFFWLTLRDWRRDEKLPFSQTIDAGLYFRGETIEQDRPKRNLIAFSFPFVAFRESTGIQIWGRTPDSLSGAVDVSIRLAGGWKSLTTVRADRAGIFNAFIKTSKGRSKRQPLRASVRGSDSLPFSLKPVRDFYHPPFGAK